jgi:hypothetical protein
MQRGVPPAAPRNPVRPPRNTVRSAPARQQAPKEKETRGALIFKRALISFFMIMGLRSVNFHPHEDAPPQKGNGAETAPGSGRRAAQSPPPVTAAPARRIAQEFSGKGKSAPEAPPDKAIIPVHPDDKTPFMDSDRLPPLYADTVDLFEGRGKNHKSSASRKYNFTDGDWIITVRDFSPEHRKWSDKRILKLKQNDDAFKEKMFEKYTMRNVHALEGALGRSPTFYETYFVHQQGLTGGLALLKHPDRNAMRVATDLRYAQYAAQDAKRGPKDALKRAQALGRSAIVNNLPTNERPRAGTMTSGDFFAGKIPRFQQLYQQALLADEMPAPRRGLPQARDI